MVDLRQPDLDEIEAVAELAAIGVDLDDRQIWIWRKFID